MSDQNNLDEMARHTVDAIEGAVLVDQVTGAMAQKENDEAQMMVDQAEVLAKAQNAADNATMPKPFTPPKEQEELFDEVRAVVESVNAMDAGQMKTEEKHLRHLEEKGLENEQGLETVVDEKIKEEQKERVEDELRDQIDTDLLDEADA